MEKNERENYARALKNASISRGFDRVVSIILTVGLLGVAVYIGIVQSNYQTQSREITRERNKQLVRVLQSNEETKAMIRCAVKVRGTHRESDVTVLDICTKETTVRIPLNLFDIKN